MEITPDLNRPGTSSSTKKLRKGINVDLPLETMAPPEQAEEHDRLLGAGDVRPEKNALTPQELFSLCMSVDDMRKHGKTPFSLPHVMKPLMFPDDAEYLDKMMSLEEYPRPEVHWTKIPFSMYPSNVPNAWTPGDETLAGMLRAIVDDNISLLMSFLDNNADPNATYPLTPKESQALCTLKWSDELSTYQQIPTWEGAQAHWSMLHWASALCRGEAVRALIARGARAAAVLDGRSALDVAGASLYQPHARSPPTPNDFDGVVRLLAGPARCHTVADAHGALHTAARLDCSRAAAALLGAGAAVGERDYSGFTALHIAIGKRSERVFDLLLNYGLQVHDAEKRRERANLTDRSGASLLQVAVAMDWPYAMRELLAVGADVAYSSPVDKKQRVYGYNYELDYTPLHLAVKSGNMKILNSILEIAKQEGRIDCRSPKAPETPLCIAITEGYLEIVKILIDNGACLRNINSDRSNALHVATEWYNSNTKILDYLLKLQEVEDLLNELNDLGEGPVHVATTVGKKPLIMLAVRGANIRLKDGRKGFTPLHTAAALGKNDLVEPIMFEDRRALYDLDAEGRTPLEVAAITPSQEMVLELLNCGASLGRSLEPLADQPSDENAWANQDPPLPKAPSVIKLITHNIPNATQFFEEIFDSSVKRDSQTGFLSHAVVNYEVLTTNEQLEVIEELIENGHDKCLVHPVIETLLYLKWLTLLPLFWFILGLNGIFVVSLNLFAGAVFYYRDIQGNATDYASGAVCPTQGYCAFVASFAVLIYLSFGVLVALEYVYVKAQGAAHWRRLESYVRITALSLGAFLPPAALAAPGAPGPRWLAAPAIVAAWLALMYLFARFPDWGYYFLMIGKVAANLAKVLLTCVMLIVAFAHVFMIFFRAEPPFDGPLDAIAKTFIMMTSEFEYENLFGDSHDKALQYYTREFVRLIFIAFVFFVALVLMNVMLGVAVNDITDLTVTGNIRRLRKQTEILTTLQDLVYNSKVLEKRKVNRNRFLLELSIAPATENAWTVKHQDLLGTNECKTKLPAHLHTSLITISKTAPPVGIRKEMFKKTSIGNILNQLGFGMMKIEKQLEEIMRKLDK